MKENVREGKESVLEPNIFIRWTTFYDGRGLENSSVLLNLNFTKQANKTHQIYFAPKVNLFNLVISI